MNCLVTKLKATVNNANLVKLGELKLRFKAIGNTYLSNHTLIITSKTAQVISLSGDVYFTDKTMAENNGTQASLPAGAETTLYVSDGDFYLTIQDKYAITNLSLGNTGVEGVLSDLSSMTALTVLRLHNTAVTGDISSLSGMTDLAKLNLLNTEVEGDISSLSGMANMDTIALSETGVEGDISSLSGMANMEYLALASTKVAGNLSSLSGMTKLYHLNLDYTKVVGNLSSLFNLTAITNLSLCLAGVDGDLSSLSGMKALTMLILKYANITGNLAALSTTLKFISTQYGASTLSWTTNRPSTANIIAMGTVRLGDDVDAMLINQEDCVASFAGTENWYKQIAVSGNRTSASDAAVSTLKGKGYTITVNGVTL